MRTSIEHRYAMGEQLLMKLGAAKEKTPAAWRLVHDAVDALGVGLRRDLDRLRRGWSGLLNRVFRRESRVVIEKSHISFTSYLARFEQLIQPWPEDVREHVRRLVAIAFRDQENVLREET